MVDRKAHTVVTADIPEITRIVQSIPIKGRSARKVPIHMQSSYMYILCKEDAALRAAQASLGPCRSQVAQVTLLKRMGNAHHMFACCVSCRKPIVGKHCGSDSQCPDSLPKPIFVIETRSSCGISKSRAIPNGSKKRRLKTLSRHPKDTPK